MEKKRLLIVTKHFPPSTSVGTKRIIRIIKFLDKLKWDIYIITQKKEYYPEQGARNDQELNRLIKEINVYRTIKFEPMTVLAKVKTFAFEEKGYGKTDKAKIKQEKTKNNELGRSSGNFKESVLKRTFGIIGEILQFPDMEIGWLPFAVVKGYIIIKKNKIDIIFSSSPNHSSHLTTVILKILTRKKLIVDFRDPWARSSWKTDERNSTIFNRLQHKWINIFEKLVVYKADKVISITQEMADDFVKNYPLVDKNKFETFYNGYDPSVLEEYRKCNDVGNRKKNDQKLTFVHVGTLYKKRDPTPLIIAIRNLENRKLIEADKVSFQFVGKISDTIKPVQKLVDDQKIGNIVEFKYKVSYKKSLNFMNYSDVLILLQPGTKLQIPGKFYDYICFEKPILAIGEKKSAIEKLIKNKFGLFADYNDINEIEKCIISLIKNPQMFCDRISSKRKRFDISKSIEKFDKILLK